LIAVEAAEEEQKARHEETWRTLRRSSGEEEGRAPEV
jgi:hypothetical protein